MGFFELFGKRADLAAGLATAHSTPGAVVLDVRTTEEYAGGHVPGSVNLPLGEIQGISLPQTTPLFVYCHSGARSSQAVAYLNAHGYTAVNLGGIAGYRGAVE